MDIQNARRRVLEIVNSCYFDIPEPTRFLTKEEFTERSTSRWAVKEIESAIRNSEDDPCVTLSNFIEKMERYALKARAKEQSMIFSIAYDTAVWVEDMVINGFHIKKGE